MIRSAGFSYRTLLLASVAGFTAIGLGHAQTINNTSPTVVSGPGQIAIGSGTTAYTSITNSSLIQAQGANGIGLQVTSGGSAATITNTNTGTISATGAGGTAVMVGGTPGIGTVGTLVNQGSIIASGGSGAAIDIATNGSVSVINNGTAGVIGGTGAGDIGVKVEGTLGSLINSGTVFASGANGLAMQVVAGGTLGSLTNNPGGTIMATGSATTAVSIGGSVGTLSNGGLIQGGTIGGGAAVSIAAGGSLTALNNGAGGTIIASGDSATAITIQGTIGTLTNAGVISGALYGIWQTGTIGTVSNAGTTSGGLVGLGLNGQAGTLTNSGLITATNSGGQALILGPGTHAVSNSGSIISSGTAILAEGAGTIVNSASGLIRGGDLAIASIGTSALTINNAGSIVGGINLGSSADVLNITGAGTVGGVITGQLGSGASVNFAPTNTYTLNNLITNVPTVNVAAGTLLIQQFGSTTTPIAGASTFNIASGATTRFNSGTVQATNFINSGMLNIGTNAVAIDGSYTQTTTGQLGVGIGQSNNGVLSVSQAVTIAGATNGIVVDVPIGSTRNLYGQTITIVSSPTLGVSNASSLTALSTNGVIQFNVTQTANALELTGVLPSGSDLQNALPPAIGGLGQLGLQNLTNVENAFYGLVAGLNASGNYTDLNQILSTLSLLTPAQRTAFFAQLQPSLVSSVEGLLSSLSALNGGVDNTIGGRLIALREGGGMAAGDEVGRGWVAWAQPFGTFLTQDRTQGVDGFTADTYGAVLGADTLVRPDLRVGLALAFGNSDVRFNGNLSGNKTSVWNTQLALYGTWFRDGFFVDGVLGGGINWYDTHENISAFGRTRDSSFTGTQFNIKLGAGYDWHVPNGMTVTPSVSIQEIHLNLNGHTTHGGGLFDVRVNGQTQDIVQSRIGARVSYPIKGPNFTFTPEVHAYYLHNFGDAQTTSVSSFTGGGPAFTTTSPTRDRDLYNIGVGLALGKIGPVAATAVYDYVGGATSHEHTIFLRLSVPF